MNGLWCGPDLELRPLCSFMFILGKGYDGVRTVPGVASNGARTVFAESVDMVAATLGRESVDVVAGVSSFSESVGLDCVGVVPSEGLVSGDCFHDFCSCFFAKASLILRRITSSPCGSCARTVVTWVCTPIDRSLCLRGAFGFESSWAGFIAFEAVGDVGVP